jgi:hypothetical protein
MSPSKSLGHGTARLPSRAISLFLTAAVRRFPSVTKRACLTVPDTVETSDWGSPRSDRCPLSIFRAIREGRLAAVTDNVAAVLGRQPISFDQWAQQNADAFR